MTVEPVAYGHPRACLPVWLPAPVGMPIVESESESRSNATQRNTTATEWHAPWLLTCTSKQLAAERWRVQH